MIVTFYHVTNIAKMSDSEVVVIESADVNGNPNSSNISNGEPDPQANSSPGPSTSNSMGPSTSKIMGPPRTYLCQESGCLKQYSRCQDLLGHYNSKHREVKIPIVVYQWKQEQDAKPKVKCPYCFKFFSQNINRWYYFWVLYWTNSCCKPLKFNMDVICVLSNFIICNFKITLTHICKRILGVDL